MYYLTINAFIEVTCSVLKPKELGQSREFADYQVGVESF